ncbi:MAG: methyl-accepting chemotaxis protein [Nitrospirae bacterium]|nr:methyl-accepting chemotaxis protein [Nitrospirota bacterium]
MHIDELNELLKELSVYEKSERLTELYDYLDEYSKILNRITVNYADVLSDFKRIKPLLRQHASFIPSIESFMIDHPNQSAELLKKTGALQSDHNLIVKLIKIDADIELLRKIGEDMLMLTRELNRRAIDNVERFIKISQTAIMILFPMFLAIVIATLFFITNNVVKRLRALIKVVENTGRGNFTERLPAEMFRYGDEVGILIKKLDEMDDHLIARDNELQKKSAELLQSKK